MSWAADHLGITVAVSSGASPVQVALRRNPARPQLLVSPLLGKHVPVAAAEVLAVGLALGERVAAVCGQTPGVLGFAETATGLGHAVAAALPSSAYAHTTRRPTPAGALRFREEHSHATDQAVAALPPGDTLVLVDDELSTGRTAANAIRAIHAVCPRRRYVLAQLLDSRTADQRAALTAAVAQLGAQLVSVSLVEAVVHVPADAAARVATLAAATPEPDWNAEHSPEPAVPQLLATDQSPTAIAAQLEVHRDQRTLVLGDEECLYRPQLIAAALGPGVWTSSTTRSPAIALDEPGYPLRTVLRFPATHEPHRPAYAYNVAPSTLADRGNAPGFEDIVLVTDAPGTHPGLVGRLQTVARRSVHLVTLA